MLLNFTTANAGLFDIFKTKDAYYKQDVAACWSAVRASIEEKNRNMDDFRIERIESNPNTGRRGIMFLHSQSWNTRGCLLDGNGTVVSTIGGKSQ